MYKNKTTYNIHPHRDKGGRERDTKKTETLRNTAKVCYKTLKSLFLIPWRILEENKHMKYTKHMKKKIGGFIESELM